MTTLPRSRLGSEERGEKEAEGRGRTARREGVDREGAVCTPLEVSQVEQEEAYYRACRTTCMCLVCQSHFDLLLLRRSGSAFVNVVVGAAPQSEFVGAAAVIDYDNHDADVAKSRERKGGRGM